eukprot:TRINITY_DN9403_c1_g1_i1.p1 TRINITY_DN9403_c1_g1~~TRINITY_DN9403_c1_g1_i1.p1  ORF type:complete len:201 (+),score=-20.43 TRINITY_DN9403_c1_g1_i1:565-1167(+)
MSVLYTSFQMGERKAQSSLPRLDSFKNLSVTFLDTLRLTNHKIQCLKIKVVLFFVNILDFVCILKKQMLLTYTYPILSFFQNQIFYQKFNKKLDFNFSMKTKIRQKSKQDFLVYKIQNLFILQSREKITKLQSQQSFVCYEHLLSCYYIPLEYQNNLISKSNRYQINIKIDKKILYHSILILPFGISLILLYISYYRIRL